MNQPSEIQNPFYAPVHTTRRFLWLVPISLLIMFFGWLIAATGISVAVIVVIFPFLVAYLVVVFRFPRVGLISFLIYSFLMPGLARHIPSVPAGLLIDALLMITWLGVIFYRGNKFRFRHLNTDLVWFGLVWFVITLLEIANPARPSIIGWLQEMRTTTLYWLMTVPLVLMIFKRQSDIFLFLDIIVCLSLLGAMYGIKQLYFGVDAAEYAWLEAGARRTHVLFGKLRVFSFYSDAGQFGASQALMAVMCLILAIGPHSRTRKTWYAVAGLVILYGMLISGTRGALGGLIGGGFVFLVLSKQVKTLILGILLGVVFLGLLKFTSVGNSNDQIRRLRSGTNLNDPSFQVRLVNQRTLSSSLANQPFGTGVGTIGRWGTTYNKHIYISRIPPDSYFVKVWAMYGIIGFILWFGIMLYILGKSAGIVWNTKDPVLRNQITSLCAGYAGCLLCSYGNEVMNTLPSSAIVYGSWALVWMSTRWDKPVNTSIQL